MTEVTLEEILDARERRALRQRELLARYGRTLISFSLNIPGPRKYFPLALRTFQEGKKLIEKRLRQTSVVFYDEEIKKTGCAGFFVTDEETLQVKRLMVEIEEGSHLGRLFDIDVLQADGMKISREEVSLSERKCLICESPAFICARSRAHGVEELIRRTEHIMLDYFNRQFADKTSEAATKALLYEVAVTPKPGLVDRVNNGAHRDMDFFTFIDSTASLSSYFHAVTLKGIESTGTSQQLFKEMRYPGLLAEDSMFTATQGVNTHKGLIFSLGVICGAAGRLYSLGQLTDSDSLLDYCAAMTTHVLEDFNGITAQNAKTAGERLYASYGMTGIRGEAASGFANVRQYALPILTNLIEQGHSINDAGVAAFMHLLANVCDTNIIHRSDIRTLNKIQTAARDFLKQDPSVPQILAEASRLDQEFTVCRISPGGSADLLAVTYMLYFLFH